MALSKKHKWIIAIVAIIILLIIAYFIYKQSSKQDVTVQSTTTTTTSPGLLGATTFAGIGAFLSNIFGGKPKTYQTTACDPSRPGYNVDGLYDNNCQ